jgi:L-fuculose-phosphate aldolase
LYAGKSLQRVTGIAPNGSIASHDGQQAIRMSSPQAADDAMSLCRCMHAIAAEGLSRGSSGNASVRTARGMRITPSGIASTALEPGQMVEITLDGRPMEGLLAPSSEWRMHAGVYAARPDVQAIVHCHSRYATALACCRRDIPAFHYMVAVAGGNSIRCAPYATFGTAELAAHALAALEGRRACLLANHGQLALGTSLEGALALAREVEELAAQYTLALGLGDVQLLDAAEMHVVLEKFRTYGSLAQATPSPGLRPPSPASGRGD